MSEQGILKSAGMNERYGFATTMIALLKEYSQELDEISKSAERLHAEHPAAADDDKRQEREFWEELARGLNYRFNTLAPACRHLVRNVSQQLEHAELDDATQIELRLRLAVFEGRFEAVQRLLPLLLR